LALLEVFFKKISRKREEREGERREKRERRERREAGFCAKFGPPVSGLSQFSKLRKFQNLRF
jgi:hypothetical protein